MSEKREFEFSTSSFERIRQFVSEHTGIVLTEQKKDMVYARLSKHIRQGGFSSVDSFCDALEEGNQLEREFMVNAITTNLTAFFREQHHFDYLRNTLIPELTEAKRLSGNKRIRVWSAGCSSGEEAYSIAMILKETVSDIDSWDIKILATDIDANMVEQAKRGVFRADRIAEIPKERLKRWFKQGRGVHAEMVKVRSELQGLITFKRLNLLGDWPMSGPFDLIFCRNVVIYFDKETQKTLFDRYADILSRGSHLFIGHSETLYNICNRFESVNHTIYKKKS